MTRPEGCCCGTDPAATAFVNWDSDCPVHWSPDTMLVVFTPSPDIRCHCGAPARGDSHTSEATGSVWHWCRQCSPEHCELDRYLRERPLTDLDRFLLHMPRDPHMN